MKVNILCPVCGRRLIDAEKSVAEITKVFIPKKDSQVDYQLKCTHCKKQIALVKLNMSS